MNKWMNDDDDKTELSNSTIINLEMHGEKTQWKLQLYCRWKIISHTGGLDAIEKAGTGSM